MSYLQVEKWHVASYAISVIGDVYYFSPAVALRESRWFVILEERLACVFV